MAKINWRSFCLSSTKKGFYMLHIWEIIFTQIIQQRYWFMGFRIVQRNNERFFFGSDLWWIFDRIRDEISIHFLWVFHHKQKCSRNNDISIAFSTKNVQHDCYISGYNLIVHFSTYRSTFGRFIKIKMLSDIICEQWSVEILMGWSEDKIQPEKVWERKTISFFEGKNWYIL